MKLSTSALFLFSATTILVNNLANAAAIDAQSANEQYINEQCAGDSYVTQVTVGENDDLWQIVKSYIDQNGEHYSPDYWLTLDTEKKLYYPWISSFGSKKGVLFILPQGASYTTTQNLDYFVWDDPHAGHRIAPRFGICSVNSNKDAASATLKLVGKAVTGTTFDGQKIYAPPLKIAQAQVELYGVNINADEVDSDFSAARLTYQGKLLLHGVDFSRHDENINYNNIGLVDNYGSYVSVMHSELTQYTNTGTMIVTLGGIDRCGGSSTVNVAEDVYPFTGYSSEIRLLTCHFNSQATASSTKKPVFFYDNYDEENSYDELIARYRYCKHSSKPDNEYPPDGGYVCSEELKNDNGEASTFKLMDNTFTGYWKHIFRARWSSFPVTPNNNFATDSDRNKLGGVDSCSDHASFSLSNDVDFDGKSNLCLKQIQW